MTLGEWTAFFGVARDYRWQLTTNVARLAGVDECPNRRDSRTDRVDRLGLVAGSVLQTGRRRAEI